MIEATLGRLRCGEDLNVDEMSAAIEAVIQGQCSESQIAALLTSLAAKGETVAEVAGAAAALRRHMTPIRTSRSGVVDTCGTGGDGSGTFNISTAAALVAAAAGVPVAKHGNRAATSKTGSADVLAALGVNVQADVPRVEACLNELGICFCYAPLLHASMKHVAAVRKTLGVRTIFNLLGPLSNPAGAPYQLLGVGQSKSRALLAEALLMLGSQHAWVVCGDDGLDEMTLGTSTRVTEVAAGQIGELTLTPADFGLRATTLESLQVDGPQQSAEVIREILAGKAGPPRDIVVMNAAAALMVAGRADSPLAAGGLATAAIDSGAARLLLARLVELSNS